MGLHDVEVSRLIAHIAELPQAVSGLTIVQLSDLHVKRAGGADVRALVKQTNTLEPDLIVLTGDYVGDPAGANLSVLSGLAALRAAFGVHAILGNHDVWQNEARITEGLEQAGIRVLRDEAVRLPMDDTGLWLIGLDDPGNSGWSVANRRVLGSQAMWRTRVAALDRLLRGIPSSEPRILLVHNPDLNECLAGRDIDLALSGHTHGGPVRLPLVGAPLVASVMGQKYVAGWANGSASPVYVSRGLGGNILNVRVNAPPEIALFTLRPSDWVQP